MPNQKKDSGSLKALSSARESNAEFTTPAKSHRHYHHPHLPHRRQEKHTTIQPTSQPNVEEHKAERETPNQSRDASRRGSLLGPGSGSDEAASVRRQRERRAVEDAELKEEKEKGALRATELHNAISGLNTFSNNTTRRLDITYYSVLEKLSALQTTIISLKELAGMTQGLNEEFQADSEEVINDVETQLEVFEGFEAQQKKVEDLSDRVRTGRDQIQVLSKRVENVKEQMDYWDKAEADWKAQTRKRIQGLWFFIIVLCLCIGALLYFFYYMPPKSGSGTLGDTARKLHPSAVPELEKMRNETMRSEKVSVELHETLTGKVQDPKGHRQDDRRLRLLDEL